MYTTAGTRRAVVALDATTGEQLWMHSENEGKRGEAAPRQLSGPRAGLLDRRRGDERIVYVTPGYQMVALERQDRRAGRPLRQERHRRPEAGRRPADGPRSPARSGCTPPRSSSKNVIVVGAAHQTGGVPKSKTNEKGYVRGFDVRTGKRLWIFHTIPRPGEFGNDTWLNDSWSYTGNAGVWAQMSVDEETDTVFLPVELPTGDYFGMHRPGNNLFGESLVARRSEHRQAQVALPAGAPRVVGHGHPVRADPRRHHGERPRRSRR